MDYNIKFELRLKELNQHKLVLFYYKNKKTKKIYDQHFCFILYKSQK